VANNPAEGAPSAVRTLAASYAPDHMGDASISAEKHVFDEDTTGE